MVELKRVSKIYDMGHSKIYANDDISMKIGENEFVFIVGKSGSGKSTLINMIGSLDYPTKGRVLLDGQDISDLDESELAQVRGKKIGFVFQSFNLIGSMTALENVMLPMTFQNISPTEKIKKAKEILDLVDLSERLYNLPSELSGGERQRVAVARALSNNPEVLIADEPTGNLDSKTGKKVMELLGKIHKQGKTVIIVTHDIDLIKRTKSHKVYKIVDGKLK
ncbi:ABC transporter ATP-binding protein [Candidatus Woesearchaeota archaeon]|nr:ABC transporter ATP-binding protein [Candidatus Woesearchaeota archaeon]MBT6023393.1 ABC transporter ATP-binding protein [Candidatus Woesearchaeota archaeon]